MTEYQTDQVTQVPDRTTAPSDLRTSQMTPLIVEHEEGVMSYPPVQFDAKPERKKAIGKSGRAFGSIETCEAVPMSRDNARWMLAATYGMETAEMMLYRADQDEYVYGEKRDLGGYQGSGKIRGGMNVAADKSRPGGYVIQVIAFVQGGIKLWAGANAAAQVTATSGARTRTPSEAASSR